MLLWSAHISMLFAERPYAERVGLARSAGFGWVETWWPETERDRDALADAVAEHGMRVALVNTDAGHLSAGERGLLGDPARRAQAERAFQDAVELAARVGARNVHALLGSRLPDLREQAQRDHVIGLLAELVPEASSRGLGVLVEALNHHDVPGYLTPTPEDVARLIEDVGSNDVRMLFDVYHLARIGRDPVAEIAVFADTIGHVHVADCPGRGAPGTGRLDLWGLVDELDASGYDGPVGLEYMPGPSTPDSLGFLAGARHPAPFP